MVVHVADLLVCGHADLARLFDIEPGLEALDNRILLNTFELVFEVEWRDLG